MKVEGMSKFVISSALLIAPFILTGCSSTHAMMASDLPGYRPPLLERLFYDSSSNNVDTHRFVAEVCSAENFDAPELSGLSVVSEGEGPKIVVDTSGKGLAISTCSLRTIVAAINYCSYRTSSQNTAQRVAASGITDIVIAGGVVGGLVSASGGGGHSAASATTLVGGFVALMQGLKASTPSAPHRFSVAEIGRTGINYFLLDDRLHVTPVPQSATPSDSSPRFRLRAATRIEHERAIRALFNSSYQACPLASGQ